MSLLMWIHTESSFIVVTDTLATTTERKPYAFQSKLWLLPEFNMAIASTGAAQLADRWYHRLRSDALARDIETVNAFTQGVLQEEWAKLQTDFPDLPTATIYHFGVSEAGETVRYIYRSNTGFNPERGVDEVFAVKPEPKRLPEETPETLDDLIQFAITVRADADEAPLPERICIGGDLILTQVSANTVACNRIYRFDDYGQMWNAMVAMRLNGTEL